MIPSINPEYHSHKRSTKDADYYLRGLAECDRYVLSEAITLIESTDPKKRKIADKVLSALGNSPAESTRIGITGSPGVGKSTFIEAFGSYLTSKGHRTAVLAIDPSSNVSGGSILGDKTRMPVLSSLENAYVRPSPAGHQLGGTSAYTKEAIRLCEAAGFSFVIVETVGVGQSETDIEDVTDTGILLLQPGAGDEIQGIKRGIMEAADIFVVNKSDSAQKELAARARAYYESAVRLFSHDIPGWKCPVIPVSSLEKTGVDTVYASVTAYMEILRSNNLLEEKRRLQEQKWFEKQTIMLIRHTVMENEKIKNGYEQLSADVASGKKAALPALHEIRNVLAKQLKP